MIVEKVMEEEVNNIIAYCQMFPPKTLVYILIMATYTSDLPVCYVRVSDTRFFFLLSTCACLILEHHICFMRQYNTHTVLNCIYRHMQ